jgi:hypothetical protein
MQVTQHEWEPCFSRALMHVSWCSGAAEACESGVCGCSIDRVNELVTVMQDGTYL